MFVLAVSDVLQTMSFYYQVWTCLIIFSKPQNCDKLVCLYVFLDFLQVKLRASDVGGSVEQIEVLIKHHDIMDKFIASQEEILLALVAYAKRLCQQKHFDKDNIAQRMDAVMKR